MTTWKNDGSILRALVLGLAVATFLVAAKAHGRQLRLERELAGFMHVTFGARNPDWVESLWARERVAFWTLAGLGIAATIGVRVLAQRLDWAISDAWLITSSPWAGGAVFHLMLPLVTAFVGTGLWSFARFMQSKGALDVEKSSAILWGSLLWWGLTISMEAGLLKLAWRRVEG